MIRSITIIPRFFLEKILTENDLFQKKHLAFISIIDVGATPIVIDEWRKPWRFWTYQFGDCNPSSEFRLPQFKELKAMTRKQGIDIVEKIRYLMREDLETDLFVSCTAGICRSGAVGLFAAEFAKLNMDDFHKRNPNILPNEWVLNQLYSIINEEQNK